MGGIMSLDLSLRTAQQVKALAEAQHTTENRVIEDLIERGLESRHYSELVERLALTSDANERKQIKEELARLTFGE